VVRLKRNTRLALGFRLWALGVRPAGWFIPLTHIRSGSRVPLCSGPTRPHRRSNR